MAIVEIGTSASLADAIWRWEKVSKNHLQRDIAEQYFCDRDGGRYTIKRLKRTQDWEAYFHSRDEVDAMKYSSDRAGAELWCVERSNSLLP